MNRSPRALLVVAAPATVVGLIASAAPAAAHTGHPTDGLTDGLVHPVFGPDHLLAMLAVGVVAALCSSRRLVWAVPGAFVIGMIGGGLAGMAGLSTPAVEPAVASSVILLGVVVAVGLRGGSAWLPLAAGLFGALHGLAHGGELPAEATPFAYLVGFVAVTIGLHLAGVLAGTALRERSSVRAGAGVAMAAAGVGLLAMA